MICTVTDDAAVITSYSIHYTKLYEFPSSIDPAFSLTAFNASSSPLTLKIMLVVALIFVPIVIIYQTWAYNLFKGKVTDEELEAEEAYYKNSSGMARIILCCA